MPGPEGEIPATAVPRPPSAPVAPAERLPLLDILRGFAVFGILVVNVLFFSGPFEWVIAPPWQSWPDRVADLVIAGLFTGKFYSIFSILFGLGFAMQMERAEARGAAGTGTYARRLVILLAIGILHAAFLWYGDILHLYAVLGFFLLFFRRSGLGAIAPAVMIGLAIPPGLAALGAIAMSFAPAGTGAGNEAAEMFRTAEALRAYGAGTWLELTRHRVRDWLMLDSFAIFFAPNVFAMMLIGVAAAKARIFHDLAARRPFFRRALYAAVVPGVLGNAFIAATRDVLDPVVPSLLTVAVTAVQAIAVPSLAIVYISAIALAAGSARGARLLAPLAPVGRMALTNYLLQSVIATLIFYSYGLGLFGRVGPATTTGLAVAIFAAQVVASGWWMKRFRFGPAEWVWRSFTYGRAQTMRA
jgi:uncharacterized protein